MTNPELGTIETAPRKANLTMSLVLRNLSFTIVVPGLGGVYVPWLILTQHGGSLRPVAWYALAVIAGGLVLYFSCLWFFGAVGRRVRRDLAPKIISSTLSKLRSRPPSRRAHRRRSPSKRAENGRPSLDATCADHDSRVDATA